MADSSAVDPLHEMPIANRMKQILLEDQALVFP
jgi:hypothetical protein